MKKHIIFLLLFFSVQLQSQTTEEFPLLPKGFKSPTSAGLGHYGEIPMSYYTGQSCLKIFEGKGDSLPCQSATFGGLQLMFI